MSKSPPAYPRPSFWLRPWAQSVLPLATSLALHAGVLGVALLVYGTVRIVAQAPAPEEQRFVPATEFVRTTLDEAVGPKGVGQDPTRPPAQEEHPEGGSGFSPSPGADEAKPALPEGAVNYDDENAVIGLSASGGGFERRAPGGGNSAGADKGVGTGTSDGRGPLAPFGTLRGGGDVRFLDLPATPAPTVVFVCDASGSMIQSFPALKAELAKAVSRLKAVQAFNIVFFQDEKCLALSQELHFAVPARKKEALRWLEDVTTTGTTNPIPALELAFRNKPKLIYLLTDGDFPDNQAVKEAIGRLNEAREVRINTVIFAADPENTSKAFVELMKQIAKDNKGVFGRVDETDLK